MDAVAKEVRGLTKAGNIIKKVLLVSNVLVMLFGLLLIGVGGAAVGKQFSALTSTTLASGIVVIGVFLLLIAFIGCWGAFKENRILLIIYFSLILLFTIVEFAVGIAAYVNKDELPTYASNTWGTFYKNDRHALNDLENQYKCCGYAEVTDRAVPPYGDEKTCERDMYPGHGACSVGIFNKINDSYSANVTYAYDQAAVIQNSENCCGWLSITEAGNATAFGVVSGEDTTQCIEAFPERTIACYERLAFNWNVNYLAGNETGENYILSYENNYRCCGWATATTQQIPPYFNSTCVVSKGYTQPCEPIVTDAVIQALGAVGGVCIALAILQLATLAITIYMIRQVPKGGRPTDDMPEPQEMVDEE